MTILSVQSHVSAGHVGNSAAVPVLQALGHPVWPVHTVLFSNHPGHGCFQGRGVEPAWVEECIAGMADLPAIWEQRTAVLSGYLGQAGTVDVVARAVDRARQGRPDLPYLCDPVIGDEGPGCYVEDGIPAGMAEHLLPRATIITPNLFELRVLTGQPCADMAGALDAARGLLALGPRVVVVTSLDVPDGPHPEAARCAVMDASGAWLVAPPRLRFPCSPNGAGDTLAALFLAAWLEGASPAEALGRAASGVVAVLEETLRLGTPDLAMVAAREHLIRPPRLWSPMAL